MPAKIDLCVRSQDIAKLSKLQYLGSTEVKKRIELQYTISKTTVGTVL